MTITTITTTAASFAMPVAVVAAAAAVVTLVARTWRTALVADVQTCAAVIANHAMADSSLDYRGRGDVAQAKSAKKSPKSVKPAAPPRGLTT